MTTIRQLAERLLAALADAYPREEIDLDSVREAATLLLSLADADEKMPRVEWRVEDGVDVDVVKRSDALAAIAAVTAERDALRADAERYRWLREGCNDKTGEATRIAVSCYGLEWDAAIDAARAKEAGNG